VPATVAKLLALLAWVPGEVSKEVDLQALGSTVALAEIADPTPFTAAHVLSVAADAVIASADAIFPDPTFRGLAVRLLSAAYPA
jgi:hypothetical protein